MNQTLERHFDACFCINLAKRKDRWEECQREIAKNFGVSPDWVRRFEAYQHPTNGHCGCTRSHRQLIRNIARGDWGRVLVLEDDFEMVTFDALRPRGFHPGHKVWEAHASVLGGNGTLNARFHYLSAFLPAYYDVLYLGAAYGEPPISRHNKHVIRCGFMQTTGSYGIHKEFAKKWTDTLDAALGCTPQMSEEEKLSRHPGPIDNCFGGMSHDHLFYVFQPRLIFQRESWSDLEDKQSCHLNSMTDPVHENMV